MNDGAVLPGRPTFQLPVAEHKPLLARSGAGVLTLVAQAAALSHAMIASRNAACTVRRFGAPGQAWSIS